MRAWPRSKCVFALCLALATKSVPARAAPLAVGPNQSYATPCAAVAAAKANDVVEIAPGTYTDSCAIAVAGLTLRGVGGQPLIDLSGTDHPANYKGIYVIDADGVTIENLELEGAHISDDNGANAAGIRVEAADLTVRGCKIHDNQNGILGGTSGSITIEHSEFFDNGQGDGCNQGGCTHNLYIANIDTLYFRFNWSHRIATDTPDKGHLLKSRAKANYIEYNRLSGEDGFDSYEIDLPNGGLAVITGNVIEKGPHAGNSTLVNWGEEGASNPDKRVFLVDNTFVNDGSSGKFISLAGATLSAYNNLFAGPGTVSNSGSLSPDNLSGVDPLFVDRAHYDYHLGAGSPALGQGVEPTAAAAFTKVEFEYVHPLASVERKSLHDVGAFESTTSAPADAGIAGTGGSGSGGREGSVAGKNAMTGGTGSSSTGGRSATSGTTSQRDAGTIVDAGAGKKANDAGTRAAATHASKGCGCSVPGSRRVQLALPAGAVTALMLAGLRLRSRRKRTRRAEETVCR